MKMPCREPRLDELLADSAMRLLMASDKVDEVSLRRLLGTVVAARPAAQSRRQGMAAACQA